MQKQVEFKDAKLRMYPAQLVIAIAKDAAGRANPITIGLSMVASYNPPMIAVAIAPQHYSTAVIRTSKCFTISLPSEKQADAALFFGKNSGRDTDKFAEFNCPNSPATKIDSIILDDAVANLECELASEIATGDHVVFFGTVVASHINAEPQKRLFITGPNHKLGTVS